MRSGKIKTKCVGHGEKKVDGYSLATGSAKFVDDEVPRKCLTGKIMTSPHAHARIKKIDISEAEKIPGVHAIIYYKNVPRIAHTTAGQGYPEPSPYDTFMFDKKVRYVGDRVAAVAADDMATANKAISKINVEYEILEPVFDMEKALEKGAPIIHDEKDIDSFLPFAPQKNLAGFADALVGDVKKGLEEADYVVEGVFEKHQTSHAAIEPHICLTYLDEKGRLVIRTSTQVPFHARRIVAQTLDIPVKNIRVIKPRVGGGFGGKQEILNEDICSMLTLRTGKPVKIAYNRSEDLISSRTRHPMRIWLKVGVKKNGDLSAVDLDGILNTGAYGSHALTVLTNVGSKCLGLFHCPNISFRGRTAYTNLPVGGAYRGYGATQGMFALGSLIDEAAEAIGMDPVEFSLKNHIREGETSPIFKALGEGREGVEMRIGSCGLEDCIKLGAKEIGWKKKWRKGRNIDGPIKRGVGMVALMQGSSIPEIDMASAAIRLNDDGSVILHVGATDIGTGSDTILSQIAAETLNMPLEDVHVISSDTDITPFDVGAYASSTTYLSGKAVLKASQRLLHEMIKVAYEILRVKPNSLEVVDRKIRVKGSSKKEVTFEYIAKSSLYMKNQQHIQATASAISHVSPPPFAANFAEVEVDIETGFVKVLKYVAAVDCGVAINPKLAEGQIEGAVLNAISSAMTEEYIFNENGKMLNTGFEHYKIYSTADAPPIKTILVETHEPTGPYGAKSVSEICTNGPLPAIANAIYDAVGVRIRKSPFTPEKVLKAIKKQL